MSWYPTDLTQCPRCHKRFSTPIDQSFHLRSCKVNRTKNGGIVAKIGTGSSEVIVSRNVIEVGKTINFTRSNGSKCRGRITMINESCTYIELL